MMPTYAQVPCAGLDGGYPSKGTPSHSYSLPQTFSHAVVDGGYPLPRTFSHAGSASILLIYACIHLVTHLRVALFLSL